ncbi:DUF4153 domain-containing protein [Dyadobacter subterraneus]|uniref:DUF4153 domain-containing protein n=1 Tax=Dyadobacter subterraneus TaxID=2773304 RepID=A0ABR9WL87_9BACT|nr:DUF4153 domain-containing protein [Dyadobacter subterraneus]MBE9466113.1 DUF4153 domain-containing protein [Dyadobacter subterraneus]
MILGILLLTGYYFYISEDPNQSDYYRFLLFLASLHLFVSFAPFLGFDETNGFWQFNKTLFLQFLNASLYSITLYIGLLIAIETVKFLFDVRFLFEIEAHLFFLIFILFHTIFFLSKIPENLESLDEQSDYPSGLKIFTQYVLLPLEVVYLAILYAYTGKIIFQWQLPEGGVAYLVLAFSVAGILALLLLYPLRETLKDRWVSLFSRRFYIAILPLILLLFTGIFRRINDYGLTENRYLVAVLALWLTGIAIYSLSVKRNDIRWIPVSLSVISFLLAVGPWNIFAVAEKSQLQLFQTILSDYKLLNAKGKIDGNAVLSDKDYSQLVSIVAFFNLRDRSVIAQYFPESVQKIRERHYNSMGAFIEKHVASAKHPGANAYWSFSINSETQNKVDIQGYDVMIPFQIGDNKKTTGKGYEVTGTKGDKKLILNHDNKSVAEIDLKNKIKELSRYYGNDSYQIPQDSLIVKYDHAGNHIKIVMTSLSGNSRDCFVSGYFLFKK